MAAIRALLNPAPELDRTTDSDFELPSKTRDQALPERGSVHHAHKKQKICKDATVFTHGPIRGECRYPPHEFQDDVLATQHKHFEVYPIGEIADYPRHIPYNSEKKFFYEKTGRESLEVFQYNFKVPGDSAQYAVLWDYNIGLVRTTPLFKCTGYSKTTPAKMLNRNPGLRDICHSITGGALVAQGYWMPYDAAKAVAATFCWKIRYALTPVFGTDFPAMCILPDSDKFGDMIIDPAITKRCTEQARLYRQLEPHQTPRPLSITPIPLTPDTPTYPRYIRKFRPQALKTISSDCTSDSGSEDSYAMSPSTPDPSYRGLWTPANTPRSVPHFPSPTFTFSRKHPAHSKASRALSPAEVSPKTQYVGKVDEAYDGDSSEDSSEEESPHLMRKAANGVLSDEKAAYLLMSLKLQACDRHGLRGKKRRASA